MPSKSKKYAQERRRRAVRKLQSAGLLGKVDLRKKPSKSERAKIIKYSDLINGRAQALKTDKKTARELRSKFKLRGSDKTVVVPKEKGERFTIAKKDGERVLRSKRKVGDQTIIKTVGEKFGPEFKRPENARVYYTLPERRRGLGRLKRHTFSSFDELLYYLQKYEIEFEDIEDHIEIEEIEQGSQEDLKLQDKLSRERSAARKRKARRKS